MEIVIEVPESEQEEISRYFAKENTEFELSKKKGLDGAQIVQFVVTYGPSTLAIINGLLSLYLNVKKVRASIKIETD
jgi:hypothetical protein